MYEYEDFYGEPNEFERQMDEIKASLMAAVKQEHQDEVERLRKENEELQAVRETLDSIKSEYNSKKNELDRKLQTLERDFRQTKLQELFKDFDVAMYRATYKNIKQPKCNKCDEQRRIPFISPGGKEMFDVCECNTSHKHYYPEEYIMKEFRRKREGTRELIVWYKPSEHAEDDYVYDSRSIYAEKSYTPEMKFEELDSYSTFFRNKDDCQAYCDWINEQELQKAD